MTRLQRVYKRTIAAQTEPPGERPSLARLAYQRLGFGPRPTDDDGDDLDAFSTDGLADLHNEPRWAVNPRVSTISTPVAGVGRIVFGAGYGNVCALDWASGELLWETYTDTGLIEAPLLVARDEGGYVLYYHYRRPCADLQSRRWRGRMGDRIRRAQRHRMERHDPCRKRASLYGHRHRPDLRPRRLDWRHQLAGRHEHDGRRRDLSAASGRLGACLRRPSRPDVKRRQP